MSYYSEKPGRQLEKCYLCDYEQHRSSCYNALLGYTTIFCCSLECLTILNSYHRAVTHYKSFNWDNLEKSVRHYCYSSRSGVSSYNMNVSQILRCVEYYTKVRLGIESNSACKEHMQFLTSEDCYGDEWSQEDLYSSDDYSDNLP